MSDDTLGALGRYFKKPVAGTVVKSALAGALAGAQQKPVKAFKGAKAGAGVPGIKDATDAVDGLGQAWREADRSLAHLRPEVVDVAKSALYMNARDANGNELQPDTAVTRLGEFRVPPDVRKRIVQEFQADPQAAAAKYSSQRGLWRAWRKDQTALQNFGPTSGFKPPAGSLEVSPGYSDRGPVGQFAERLSSGVGQLAEGSLGQVPVVGPALAGLATGAVTFPAEIAGQIEDVFNPNVRPDRKMEGVMSLVTLPAFFGAPGVEGIVPTILKGTFSEVKSAIGKAIADRALKIGKTPEEAVQAVREFQATPDSVVQKAVDDFKAKAGKNETVQETQAGVGPAVQRTEPKAVEGAGGEGPQGPGGGDRPQEVRQGEVPEPLVQGQEGQVATPEPTPESAPRAKEPWQMTREEWDAHLKSELQRQTDAYNAAGGKGLNVPRVGMGTVGEKTRLAEIAGYKLPEQAHEVVRMDWHKLRVEAALAEGKPVPPEVLKDYPDLAEKANAVQIESPTPGVPREEGPQVGLRQMGERDAQGQAPPGTPEAQEEGLLGPVELNAGVNFRQMAEAMNTGKSGGKLYSTPWDKLKDFFSSGLTTIDRTVPLVGQAVRKLGNSKGEAGVIAKTLVAHIDRNAGKPGFFNKEVVPVLVESRLRGIRQRWAELGEADKAAKVPTVMDDAAFDAAVNDPKVQAAIATYKGTIEKALAESHASNEGVFSDALGPLETYYPLTRLDAEGNPAGSVYGRNRGLLAKPGNPRSKMATGQGDSYDLTPEGFQRAVTGMVATNNRGAMVKALEDSGIAKVVPASEAHLHTTIDVNGVTWDAKAVSTGVPGKVAIVPSGMAKELDFALNKGLDASSAHGFTNVVNHIALQGLAEPVVHSLNLIGTIISEPLKGGLNPLTRVTGNVPGLSTFSKLGEVLFTKTLDERGVADLQDMARIGLLPGKTASVTWSKAFAESTGAKLAKSLSPVLYGPQGFDVKARLYMYRLAKATIPNATDLEVANVVNRLPEYNKAAEAVLERFVKGSGASPFYTAGKTMLRNGVDAWLLGNRLPKSMGLVPKASVVLGHQIGNGVLGFTGLWIVANKAVTGKFPWENHARYGEIPVGGGKAYSIGWANPVVMRGSRALGLKGAFDTWSEWHGARPFQIAEAGLKGAVNAWGHPVTGGPIVRMGSVALTGMEPQIAGFRDYFTGKSQLGLYRGAPDVGSGQIGTNVLYGLGNVNTFALQALEKLGLIKPVYKGKKPDDSDMFQAMVELSGIRPLVDYDRSRLAQHLQRQAAQVRH